MAPSTQIESIQKKLLRKSSLILSHLYFYNLTLYTSLNIGFLSNIFHLFLTDETFTEKSKIIGNVNMQHSQKVISLKKEQTNILQAYISFKKNINHELMSNNTKNLKT